MTRRLPPRHNATSHARVWGTLALSFALGCGSDSALFPDQGGDMGVPSDLGSIGDASFPDQGPMDGSVPTGTLLPADPTRFAPFLAAAPGAFGPTVDDQPAPWTSCYERDASCASAPCALLATCCVAEGDCAELQVDSTLPPALLFSSCSSGASALTCLPGPMLTALGSSTPTVEAGGLRPGGDGTREGGVLVGVPLDLGVDRVGLSVVFEPPLSCPNSACLESAGVSLAPADEVALGVVNPLVGLLYSPSRGDVSLVVGDQIRSAWTLTDPSASFTLELHPSGTVRVYRDDLLLTDTFSYVPRANAQVVLHGRNTELQGARVRSLHALRYRTEATAMFETRGVITLVPPVDVSPWAPRDASVAAHEGRTYVVVENDGALYRGELLGSSVSFDSAQRVEVNVGRDEQALSSPALLLRPGGEAFLLYAVRLTDGTRAIRARGGNEGALGALPTFIAVADAGPGHTLDDPSVLEHAGRFLLVLRHQRPDGSSELELWTSPVGPASPDPTLRAMTPAPASNLGELTRLSDVQAAQSELRAPHLSVRGGTYRVHYERRSGTRSVIELLVTDELRAFRGLGEVLAPRPGQLDALGVGSPSAVQDPSGHEALYYAGRDGVTERLWLAERDGVLDPSSLRDP